MSECTIIDTYPAFLSFWAHARELSIEEQIDRWASDYTERWPELLQKQQASYLDDNLDWRKIARERVFPFLSVRLPAMELAHANLPNACETIYRKAQTKLSLQTELTCVFYVGIGCGAGWVTSFGDSPAILFGLEMIAECGWCALPALMGLVAHEMGHVAHHFWRREYGTKDVSGPWWDLYTEGFAQRCEHVILGTETWHECTGVNQADWVSWCRGQKGWLAREFLRRVNLGESVRPFFGSWLDLNGRKQCGYFLGHEVIAKLEKQMDLRKIALLENVENICRTVLAEFAANDS